MRPLAASLPGGILRASALLVPAADRRDWLAEWTAELWHVTHASDSTTAARFAWGAVKDAWCLRRADVPPIAIRPLLPGSASRCLSLTAAFAALGVLACLTLPASRQALLASQRSSSTFIVSADGYDGIAAPTMRLSEYRQWQAATRTIFSGTAFLEPLVKRVHFADHDSAQLNILRTDPSIAAILPFSPATQQALRSASTAAPAILVSERIWRDHLQNPAAHPGDTLRLGNQPVTFAGVLPGSSPALEPAADILLLSSPPTQGPHTPGPHTRGYVLARLNPQGIAASAGGWWKTMVAGPNNTAAEFDCISTSEINGLPRRIFWYTLLLALLSLPATTPLPLGDYSIHSPHGPRPLARWIFLAAKLLLGLIAAGSWSMTIAYSLAPVGSAWSLYAQVASSFAACLWVLRWAWKDQRKRCPECLHLLANPARVGQASQSFLAWSGTEWVCGRGHGVLHIPELPTSWLSIQRWLVLDYSWRSLFSDPYSAS